MSILQSESGLSSDDYNLLKTLKTGSVYKIIAHQYNLAFQRTYSSSSVLTEATPDFDAVICNGYLYRAVSYTLVERYDIAGNTWSTVSAYVAPTSPISSESISLVTNGTILYAYAATSSGISVSSTSDNGATWSSWTQIIAVTNVFRISAASPTHVHYVVKDTTKLIYNLRVAINNSGWTATASDIWLQYAPANIAAVTFGTKDVIAMSCEVPGTVTITTLNGTAVKYMKPSGGILVFNFQYGSWSDHREVDIVDDLTAYRYRDRVKISVIDNRLFLTAFTADGTQQFPFTMYRMYTSKDGIWWAKGEAIPLAPDEGARSGIKLLISGDYVYAVERKQVHRSLSTLATGHSPTSLQVDLNASGAVMQYQVTQDSTFQSAIVLSNANGWLDDHAILNKENRILLVHSFGYRNPTTHAPIMVQVATTEVDTIDTNRELPKSLVRMTSRDFLAWMAGRTGAERPYIWDSQLLGADDFSDYTSTGYDGLRHLAQESGSWTADENTLLLQSSNVEGVGFSTYASDLWNGETQCGFSLATIGNNEYAGVVFRAVDKDNLLIAYYNQILDAIVLGDRNGGIGSIFATSSSLSWASTPTTTRYIRVEFHYARINVQTSTDGAVWTQQISYLQSSPVPSAGEVDKRKFRGFVGFIGMGYAPPDVANWSPDPGPDSPPFSYPYEPGYTDPYTENLYNPGTIFTPTAPGAPPVTSITLRSDGNTQLLWDDTHLKMVTTGIMLDAPPERDITPTLADGEIIMDAKADRYSPGVYCLVSNGTNSRVFFAPNLSVYPTLAWSAGASIAGEMDTIELGSAVGKIAVKGAGTFEVNTTANWNIGTGAIFGGVITERTATTITVSSTNVGSGRYQIGLTTNGDSVCNTVRYEILSGGYVDFVDWTDCGYAPIPEGAGWHYGNVNGQNARAVLAFTDTTGPFSIKFTFGNPDAVLDASDWSVDLGTELGRGITSGSPYIDVEAEHHSAYGGYGLIIKTPSDQTVCTVAGTIIAGDQNLGGTAWCLNNETYNGIDGTFPHSSGFVSNIPYAIHAARYTSTTPITWRFVFDPECSDSGDGLFDSEVVYVSTDHGLTVGNGRYSESYVSGFDVQKVGNSILLGGSGQTLISDGTSDFEDYGSPKAQGSIYIPRLLFGSTSTLNNSANPQYLLSAIEEDEDDHSLWRVSSSGDAFTNITPISGGHPGLSTGEGCIIGHWMTSSHILGLLSFNGTVKMARSIDKGAHWTFSAALDSGVKGIVTRRGDFDAKQVWWINGDKIAYCQDYTLPTLTFVERTFSLDSIKGIDIYG